MCEICLSVEAGMDVSHRDVGMMRCHADHTFCEGHATLEMTDEERDASEDGYEVPERICPICSLQRLSVEDELAFLRRVAGTNTAEGSAAKARDMFGTFAALQENFGKVQTVYGRWVAKKDK
jgi:hypothetical protein